MKPVRKALVIVIFLLLPAVSFSGDVARYTIIYSGINLTDIEEKVGRAIIAGWQPLGGMVVGCGSYGCTYYQTMVKYDGISQ